MINGVIVTPLKKISNPKGDIFRGMKVSDNGYKSFGEAYFTNINFNEIKGWKKHHQMILNIIVPIGSIRFVLYDDRLDSCTYKNFFDVTITPESYSRLTVPAGVWMAFQGIGNEQNLLLNIASIEHDPAESVNCDLFELEYQW